MEAWLPSIPDTGCRTEYWTQLMETAPSVCRDVFLDDPMGDPWESWTNYPLAGAVSKSPAGSK